MLNKNIDSIGFDLDGTLWDSLEPVIYSWQEALRELPDIPRVPTNEEVKGIMGLPPLGIATTLFPYLSEQRAMEVFDIMTKVEIEHVAKVGGILFEGLEETLEYLSGKYKLYIVSNCQKGYIEAFLEFHKLGKYFVDRENAENTGLSKGKNIRLVMERNGLENTVYVGDTIGDQNAAKEAGVPFIFAGYGFGKAEAPETVIESIKDLKNMF
ncbi:MAG: HAD family hydrolase [Clostridia bacterium]|nr:HAD family hydrolase [Clostridia bacterium]